jgi:glucokinase
MSLVVVDVGGTHIRFAIAKRGYDHLIELEQQMVVRTADYPDLKSAWAVFEKAARPLPRDAAIAVACPTDASVLRLTNVQWTIAKDSLPHDLGLDRIVILNDFVAVGHAVLSVPKDHLLHVCGPQQPLPSSGIISVVGPGTGLGVAQIFQSTDSTHIIATEAGHIGFAPVDEIDDALLARLRRQHGRVSAERVVAGPSLVDIYEVMAEKQNTQFQAQPDKALWPLALSGTDHLAKAALERFCLNLGRVAGDIALAQGADGVVIAGGLGLRLVDHIKNSSFRTGFINKGRFQERMTAMPVKLITTPQPGLVGAAHVFFAKYLGAEGATELTQAKH